MKDKLVLGAQQGLVVTSRVRCGVQIAVRLVGNTDISHDALSLPSPVIRAEEISVTVCPARRIHLLRCHIHRLYYC